MIANKDSTMADEQNGVQNPAVPPTPPAPTPVPPSDEGGIYGKLQREKAAAEKEAKKARERAERAEAELAGIENLPDKRAELRDIERKKFEAEAAQARYNLVQQEFPQLKGKENFIPLDTIENMRASANNLIQSFGLPTTPGGSQQAPASDTFSATVDRLANLSPKELKEELNKFPMEVVEKLLNELKARGVL